MSTQPSQSDVASVHDRTAIVTGGNSGIGQACARALADQGYFVIVGSRRAPPTEAIGIGMRGASWPLDVADAASVDAFCARVTEHRDRIDVLVNAAGIYVEAQITQDDTSHWHDQIATNLTGAFNMTRAVMPKMIAQKYGRIINIASTAARLGSAGYAGYCASKAGLVALSQATAQEGAPHGVNCVSVSPTWVETPMMDASIARKPGLTRKGIAADNPQNRLVQPQEVAEVVRFLATTSAAALTSEDIQVNAGAIW